MNTLSNSYDIVVDIMWQARDRYLINWRESDLIIDFVRKANVAIQESAPNLISWREEVLVGGAWQWKQKTAKFGRFLTATVTPKLGIEFNDSQVEKIVNLYKAQFNVNDLRIEMVTGEEIRHYYHVDNYSDEDRTGDLHNSCMRHEETQEYLDIYCENERNVALLVALDEMDRTVARSIIWTDDHGDKFQDRIYGTQVTQEVMRRWASDNGIESVGSVRLALTLEYANFGYYPYADSMYYLNPNTCQIANYKIRGAGHMQSLYGELEGLSYCSGCSEQVDEDDLRCVGWNYLCSDCIADKYTECEGCEELVSNDNINYIEGSDVSVCDHCHTYKVFHCDGCETDYFNESCEDCENREEDVA